MDPARIPTYRFNFGSGLSKIGRVERHCSMVDGGGPRQIGYYLEDLPLAASLASQVPSPVADLIDVASAIFIADRLALREPPDDPRPSHDRWHRCVHVVVPLRHPSR